MKIRKATKKDIPRMFEILKGNSPRYPEKVALLELNEMFSEALFRPTYLIVEDKGEVVAFGGFVSSWVDNAIVNMFWINVDSEVQGKGVGAELIEGLIREIEKIRKPKVKMVLISTDIPGFYEKFRFEEMGDKYDGDYVLMGRRLG